MAAGEPSPASTVMYLYGVVPSGETLPSNGDTTVALDLGALVAIVDHVPAGDFSGEALDARLQDVAWVADRARRHTEVLARAMDASPVVPARLCTVFSGEAALREALGRNEPALLAALSRVRGRREWAVKVFADAPRMREICEAEETTAKVAVPAAAASGTGWLARKQAAIRLDERIAERSEAIAEGALDALAQAVVDVRVRPSLGEAVTGCADAMILNAALLADRDAEPEMHVALDEVAAALALEGCRLEFSGPWPPFTFCDPDDVAAEEAGVGEVCGSPG